MRQDPAFATAMRNIPSFGAFIKLFDTFELITSNTSGGTSKVRLTDNAPPRRRRARTKRPDPKYSIVYWCCFCGESNKGQTSQGSSGLRKPRMLEMFDAFIYELIKNL